jgi:hypothetical protein
MRGIGAGTQETLRVVLLDEESKHMPIGRGATYQCLVLLKTLRRELWTVGTRHRNWVKLDVLAMRIDEKLREVDPRPQSQDQPGILTRCFGRYLTRC